MKTNKLKECNGKNLRKEYPNSHFLDEDFDKAILGVNKGGSIKYHHYELLYSILDKNKDEFHGDDYEHEKYEFTDEFIDFYDRFDEQLQMEFSQYETVYESGVSKLIPPVLITF